MSMLFLLACRSWTTDAALGPFLARMDADGNGKVVAAEYEALNYHGPPFEEVDLDKNASLSLDEFEALVHNQDPVRILAPRPAMKGQKGPPPGPPPGKRPGPPSGPSNLPGVPAPGAHQGPVAPPPETEVDKASLRVEAQWVVKMILLSLCEEIRSVDASQPLPTEAEMVQAAATADIRSAASRALLLRLEQTSDTLKLDFPAALRAKVLEQQPLKEPQADLPEMAPTLP